MNKLNLRWQDNMSPDIDAHNLQSMTDGINDLIDETESIENKISEIESTKVVANPKRKPKYALNTIMIGDDVYLVDGNAGTTVYDLLGTQTGEVAKAFSPKEDTKQIILMAVYNRVFQGSATIDLEEKTIKGTIASVEKEIYDKYVGQLWDEDKSYKNTFEYNIVSDDWYSFYWNGEDGFGTEELRVTDTGKLLVASSYYALEVAVIAVEKSADIGVDTWEELENKPFESLNDDNFEVSEDGVLSVIGGGGTKVEKMTWERYEALSDEEKHDGTLRHITDKDGYEVMIDDTISSDKKTWSSNKIKTSLNNKVDKVSGSVQQIQVTSGDTALKLKANSTSTYMEFDDKDNTRLGYLGVNASKKPSFYDTTEHQLALDEKVPHRVGISSNGVYDLNIANFQSALFFGTANATVSNVILFTRNNTSVATASNILGSQASQFNVSIVNGLFHIVAPKDTSGVIIY